MSDSEILKVNAWVEWVCQNNSRSDVATLGDLKFFAADCILRWNFSETFASNSYFD